MVNIDREYRGKPHAKVFISHSHTDRDLAASIKNRLEGRFNIDVFVAHDDIKPSEEWQETILSELKDTNVFIMLLSSAFENSDWTDQETGISVFLRHKIIPISLGTNPYGFAGKYQALKWKGHDFDWSMRELVMVLYTKGILSKDEIIEYFTCSNSFKEADENTKIIDYFRTREGFTERQLMDIAMGLLDNSQLVYVARSIVIRTLKMHKFIMDDDVGEEFRKRKWVL